MQGYCVNYYQKSLKSNEILRVNGGSFSQVSPLSMVRNQIRTPWEESEYFSHAKSLDFLCSSIGSGPHLLPCYEAVAKIVVRILVRGHGLTISTRKFKSCLRKTHTTEYITGRHLASGRGERFRISKNLLEDSQWKLKRPQQL